MRQLAVLAFGLTFLASGAAQAGTWNNKPPPNSWAEYAAQHKPANSGTYRNPVAPPAPPAPPRPPKLVGSTGSTGGDGLFHPYRGTHYDTSVYIHPKTHKEKVYESPF
jgi:hypothetical protein